MKGARVTNETTFSWDVSIDVRTSVSIKMDANVNRCAVDYGITREILNRDGWIERARCRAEFLYIYSVVLIFSLDATIISVDGRSNECRSAAASIHTSFLLFFLAGLFLSTRYSQIVCGTIRINSQTDSRSCERFNWNVSANECESLTRGKYWSKIEDQDDDKRAPISCHLKTFPSLVVISKKIRLFAKDLFISFIVKVFFYYQQKLRLREQISPFW